MAFPVCILAGGLATRLRPLSETIPKSLVPVAGEPFIAHQLRLLCKNGITQVVICAGYLGEQIAEFVGDGKRFGVKAKFVYDGECLLGTGGAIKKALPYLGAEFFVLYGDSYLLCDYEAVQSCFRESQMDALMTVYLNDSQWDNSNVEYNKGKILVYDKVNRNKRMRYIDYGLGIFASTAFEQIPEGTPYDLADLYKTMLTQERLAAFEVHERFYEIGSFKGIEALDRFLVSSSRENN